VQDDYLDAFGDPQKFGKKPGGDVMANKKTFLWLRALEVASQQQKNKLSELLSRNDENKIEEMLQIYKSCNIDAWAKELKQKYFALAIHHLEETAVVSARKKPLEQLAEYLMDRDA
jgi:geranylgeranyl diphosphate synthase type II